MKLLRAALLFGLLSLLALNPVVAKTDTPLLLLKTKLETLRKLAAQKKSIDGIRIDLKVEMDKFFDYKTLGDDALKGYLEKESDENKKNYRNYFKKMIQRIYLKRYKPGTVFTNTFGEQTTNGTEAKVETELKYKRSSADIVYKLHKTSTGWMVKDVVVDELSFMRSYRKRFIRVIKKNSFQSLLERMKKSANRT